LLKYDWEEGGCPTRELIKYIVYPERRILRRGTPKLTKEEKLVKEAYDKCMVVFKRSSVMAKVANLTAEEIDSIASAVDGMSTFELVSAITYFTVFVLILPVFFLLR
jgi:hypothetical protein